MVLIHTCGVDADGRGWKVVTGFTICTGWPRIGYPEVIPPDFAPWSYKWDYSECYVHLKNVSL